MNARLTVDGHDGPPVRENLCVVAAQIEHGLDGEYVSVSYSGALPGCPVVWYLRIFVHPAPDSMADIFSNDRISFGFRQFLHGPANIPKMLTFAALFDRPVETFFGDADHREQFGVDGSDGNGRGG